MKSFYGLFGAVALSSAALIATSGASQAGDYTADLLCTFRDTKGNRITYAFGPNTFNANGSFGGTLIETGFQKNGRVVYSERGSRSIWMYGPNNAGGMRIIPQRDRQWIIGTDEGWDSGRVFKSNAALFCNGVVVARGMCGIDTVANAFGSGRGRTAATVGDEGM